MLKISLSVSPQNTHTTMTWQEVMAKHNRLIELKEYLFREQEKIQIYKEQERIRREQELEQAIVRRYTAHPKKRTLKNSIRDFFYTIFTSSATWREPLPRYKRYVSLLRIWDGWDRPPDYKTFGTSTHRYKFNPCLTEDTIAEFESAHRIKLPTDYRDFLKYVGNGGSGPDHGIMTLSRWQDYLYYEPDSNFLSTPFPHTAPWDENMEEGEFSHSRGGITEEGDKLIAGSMAICEHGCGIYYLLVVTGEEAGHVWVDCRGNSSPGLQPILSVTGQRMTFIEWYDEWLSRSILALEKAMFDK